MPMTIDSLDADEVGLFGDMMREATGDKRLRLVLDGEALIIPDKHVDAAKALLAKHERPFAMLEHALLAHAKRKSDAVMQGGIPFAVGAQVIRIPTDAVGLAHLHGNAMVAESDAMATFTHIGDDHSVVTMNAAQVLASQIAVAQFTQAVRASFAKVIAAIKSGVIKTPSAIDVPPADIAVWPSIA